MLKSPFLPINTKDKRIESPQDKMVSYIHTNLKTNDTVTHITASFSKESIPDCI